MKRFGILAVLGLGCMLLAGTVFARKKAHCRMEKKFAKEFELTDEQKKQIKEIRENEDLSRGKKREQIEALLTLEQREKMRKRQGKGKEKLAEELGLTAEQKEQIREIRQDESLSKREKREKINNLLTEEQREKKKERKKNKKGKRKRGCWRNR
ncbi:MAG: hypothetical protein J7M11_04295 [Elusimicrobia bacterium]|nr:hypothetical protein [Elusimicrobiota bacterium]